jgi:peptide/nickel transport system substrate-binding protein
MWNVLFSSAMALACTVTLAVQPAVAQKSKDTLRFPVFDIEAGIDMYTLSGSFANVWGPSVFNYLIDFDSQAGVFAPHLAKSWSQPTPTSYEFELRDDIKWHDGESLDADDVVYTLNYLLDPKVNLRHKIRWSWIESVEKLGPRKVRLTASRQVPFGLMWMASYTPIYPQHAHGAEGNKLPFAARPIGTGPLRIVKMDRNDGIVAEKFAAYVPSAVTPPSGVGRVVAEPVNDMGSLTAMLLTGKADLAVNLPSDQADALRASGRFEVSLQPPGVGYSFLGFPSKGANTVKALADVRVRTAIIKAIDRQAVLTVKLGELARDQNPPDALCSKTQLGCGYTKLPPAYDPAGAKKLLAEAGYADGFDVVINCFPANSVDATAIAGMLRAVGIRATVRQNTTAQRVQLLSQGKIEIGYFGWDGGSVFDVSGPIGRHVEAGEYEDAALSKLAQPVHATLDDAQRRKMAAPVFDYITENAYAFAIIPGTSSYTHTKEVKLNTSLPRAVQVHPHEFTWK